MVAAAAPKRAAMAAPVRSPSSARATCGSRDGGDQAGPGRAERGEWPGRLGGDASAREGQVGSGRSGARRPRRCRVLHARRPRPGREATARRPAPRRWRARGGSRSRAPAWRRGATAAAARLAGPSCSRLALRRACHSSSTRPGRCGPARWGAGAGAAPLGRCSPRRHRPEGWCAGGGREVRRRAEGAREAGQAPARSRPTGRSAFDFGSSSGRSPSTSDGAWTWAPAGDGRQEQKPRGE